MVKKLKKSMLAKPFPFGKLLSFRLKNLHDNRSMLSSVIAVQKKVR